MDSSTESAIVSRLTSEDRMPSCPIAMPSVTVMVQNSRGVPSPFLTPSEAACAWRIRAVLHGAASFQQDATPTRGFWMSLVDRPMA